MRAKDFTKEVFISVITNLLTSAILFTLGFSLNFILDLRLPTPYLIGGILLISAVLTISIFRATYEGILSRLSHINFLAEDSATKSFELFSEILRKVIIDSKISTAEEFEKKIFPLMQMLIDKRKQPMQIIQVDTERILTRAKQYSAQTTIVEQILYYLDFMAAYKRMATPRIVHQANLYLETFGTDGVTDYVVIYGHSTVVVDSTISGYKIDPFPIIVVEDLQYHKQSLGEHKIVCKKLRDAGVPFTLIKFDQIQNLFDQSMTFLASVSGENLPLLRKRRIHAFIGCERVDLSGNTLVPSESKGIPSESAQFLQEIETYSQEKGSSKNTPARVVLFSESYKIRNFDRVQDIRTHVPLRGYFIQSLLYIVGLRSDLPSLHPVSLFTIDAKSIYVHINELGIFPNIGGKFDLRYCENVFDTETNLLGFFSKPLLLKYKIFDEVKAVLFDLNGVLIDDEQIHYLSFAKVLSDFGKEFTLSEYEDLCLGRSDIDGFEEIRLKYQIDTEIEVLVSNKHAAYLKFIGPSKVKLFPGSIRLLKELKNRGYKISLVTASSRQEAEMLLVVLGLNSYFDVVITDDDVVESKPSPKGYLTAAEKLMIAPSRCLVIDDSPQNISNAHMKEMKTVHLLHKGKISEYADFIINSLEDLLVL